MKKEKFCDHSHTVLEKTIKNNKEFFIKQEILKCTTQRQQKSADHVRSEISGPQLLHQMQGPAMEVIVNVLNKKCKFNILCNESIDKNNNNKLLNNCSDKNSKNILNTLLIKHKNYKINRNNASTKIKSEVFEKFYKNEGVTFLESNFKYKRRIIQEKQNYNLIQLIITEFVKCMKKLCQCALCVKMLNNYPIGYIFLLTVIISLGFIDMTEAGACWMSRGNNGKCKELFSKNISKEECCKYGQEFAFTDKDLSDAEYFFAAAIGDGATCASCTDSCDAVKCGINKRCAIRKGRPKCVCSLICKESKDKKSKKNNSIRIMHTRKNENFKNSDFDHIFPSTNIKTKRITSGTISDFEQRWITVSPYPPDGSAIQQKQKQQSTENLQDNTSSLIDKNSNQRKSDSTKRKGNKKRKSSILSLPSSGDDVSRQQIQDNSTFMFINNEKQHSSKNHVNNDSDFSESNGNGSSHLIKSEHSQNIVIVQSGDGLSQPDDERGQMSFHQRRCRHKYKKNRKFMKDKMNASLNATTGDATEAATIITVAKTTPTIQGKTITNAAAAAAAATAGRLSQRHPVDRRMQDSQKTNQKHSTSVHQHHHERNKPRNFYQMTLDEKLRNGFFDHGFPQTHDYLTGEESHGRYYNPVCGSDGRTYKTECQLRKRACRREISLSVAYRGHCQTSCKSVQCLNGLTCVEDQYGIPHCISCQISCPRDYNDGYNYGGDPTKAVCGVDGRTYKSVCDINRMTCITGRSIAVAYYGPCQESANCNNIHCGERRICLTDLITHKPRCVSCSFKCPRKRRPQGQRYEDGQICGNNNHTYYSWCHMRRDSCDTEFYIDVKHVGVCHKDSFKSREKVNTHLLN